MFVDAQLLASRSHGCAGRGSSSFPPVLDHLETDAFKEQHVREILTQKLNTAVDDLLSGTGETGRGQRDALREKVGALSLNDLSATGRLAAVRRLVRRLWRKAGTPETQAWKSIEILGDALRRLDNQDWDGFDELAQVKTAYFGLVNPVHFVPQAFAFGETCAVACWLGGSFRNESTFMPGYVCSYWEGVIGDSEVWPESEWAPDAFLVDKASVFMSPNVLRRWIAASRTGSATARRVGTSLVIATSSSSLSGRGTHAQRPSLNPPLRSA